MPDSMLITSDNMLIRTKVGFFFVIELTMYSGKWTIFTQSHGCIITKWGKCYVSRKEPRLLRLSWLLEKWCGGDAGVRSERQRGRVGAFLPVCQCAWGGGLGSEQRPGCPQRILLPLTHKVRDDVKVSVALLEVLQWSEKSPTDEHRYLTGVWLGLVTTPLRVSVVSLMRVGP